MKSFSVFSTKAFTLIELLVVISIIGLLSSVVLASLTTTRTKAKLAAGKQFDASTYHAYGADAPVYWSMDAIDTSPTRVSDLSGNLLNLSVAGAPQVVSGILGNAINFQSSADRLSITVPATSALSGITSKGGTVSLWFKPSDLSAAGQGQRILFFAVGSGSNRIYLRILGSTVSVVRGSSATNLNIGEAKVGEWTNVALSWTGGASGSTQTMKGYLNGTKISEAQYTEAGDLSGATIILGQQDSTADWNNFLGVIDEVHIYSNALADSQIRSMYLAEAPVVKRLVVQEK
ncbi:MAG: prepilin-type N-terminal cleavage/methylation domain-containing protein [Candidatus Taylorbacteria bacterium]|nr:prepilin-type N-terminal cleavage/methylation domain-containing protein [Candidatus Taylorbacteria bacterium]